MINNPKELLEALERQSRLDAEIREIGHNCTHESLQEFLHAMDSPVEEVHQLLLEIRGFFARYIGRRQQKPPVDLDFHPGDDQLVRRAKDLLRYGGHKDDCDQYLDDTAHERDQQCCSCGWCLAAGSAYLDLMLYTGQATAEDVRKGYEHGMKLPIDFGIADLEKAKKALKDLGASPEESR